MVIPRGVMRWLPFHYGWVVVALTFVTTLTAAGVRASLPVFIQPLESQWGWSRASLASAISVSLLLYGVAAPIAGRLIDWYGPRRVMIVSLALVGIGAAGTVAVRSLWQLVLVWGVAIGLGAGGAASVLAASVASRWFVARRGLVVGLLNSASSTGQLIFLPVLMGLVLTAGWQAGLMLLAAVALGLIPFIFLFMQDEPSHMGLRPFGADESANVLASTGRGEEARQRSSLRPGQTERLVSMGEIFSSRVFWMLALSFFACGATSAGLVGTHLIPHALDRGIAEMSAAAAVGIMGGVNFVGTMLSGGLTDQMDPRRLLAVVFTLRSLSLFLLPLVRDQFGLLLFAVAYGLNWFATVPPIVALTADEFGRRSVASVYGWVFLAHQVGASLAALGAGFAQAWFGDYTAAFIAGGMLALIGAVTGLAVPASCLSSRSPAATSSHHVGA